MLSDSSILRHVGRQSKKMATYKQLVRELGLKGEARRELADRLHALVKKGDLLEIDSGRYSLPKATTNRNMLVGRLSMHRDGFGFVIPDAARSEKSRPRWGERGRPSESHALPRAPRAGMP